MLKVDERNNLMTMGAPSSENCTTSFGYNMQQKDGQLHKVSLTEENDLVRKAARICQNSAKRVTFAKSQVVGRVSNRADCSSDEIKIRWYTKDEYSELIWESSVTLTMMKCEKKAPLVDDTLLCSRGLLDTETLLKRQEERKCINKLVLLELKETQDGAAAARLYQDIALIVCQRARDQAIADEEYARRYTSETNQPSELYYRRSNCSQAENHAAIEQMILRELQKSPDKLDATEQKLMRGLKRLNKRKEMEAEKARQLEELAFIQQLQQLADLYADPSLTPEQRAAVELAANELVHGSTNGATDETSCYSEN